MIIVRIAIKRSIIAKVYQARRCDNDEKIQGYYVKITGRRTIHYIYTGYADFDCDEVFPDRFEINPETLIEMSEPPVWVKAGSVNAGYACSSCNAYLGTIVIECDGKKYGNKKPKYCNNCGQKLNWEL